MSPATICRNWLRVLSDARSHNPRRLSPASPSARCKDLFLYRRKFPSHAATHLAIQIPIGHTHCKFAAQPANSPPLTFCSKHGRRPRAQESQLRKLLGSVRRAIFRKYLNWRQDLWNGQPITRCSKNQPAPYGYREDPRLPESNLRLSKGKLATRSPSTGSDAPSGSRSISLSEAVNSCGQSCNPAARSGHLAPSAGIAFDRRMGKRRR